MNLEARKLEFIQEFLKVQSEDVINRLEKLLKKENNIADEKLFSPMTVEELHKRIDKSELDFENGNVKSQEDLERISANW